MGKTKTTFFRTLAVALTALLVVGSVASCAKSGGSTDQSGIATAAASQADTSAVRLYANVPDADYGGYTFTFLAHEEPATNYDWIQVDPRELVADSETGEAINDAVYKRNATISDKYNVKFAMIPQLDEVTALKKSVASGDNSYDCAIIFNNNVPPTITANILMNCDNLKYIDRSQPWWDPAANGMTIDNKCYVLAGDLTILDKEATNSMFFNKDMIAALGLDSPYDLVNAGTWTFDKLGEMIKNVGKDLNGDGKMDMTDQYGLLCINDTLHSMLVSGGGSLAVKDANDEPVMSLADPNNIAIGTAAMNILYDKANVFDWQAMPWAIQSVNTNYSFFEQGKDLFFWARLAAAEFIRDSDVNFGIVPMPKYDTNQKDYLSAVNPYTGVMIGVPKTCTDTDRTSAVIETLCCESRYILQPAYYDETLQRKLVRDNDSSAMLDIIFAHKVYDIGAVYAFGNCFLDYISLFQNYNTDIASYYAKNQAKMSADIKKIVGIFQSNT